MRPIARIQPHRSDHNLPVQLTSFIGRERDVEAVWALLRSSRLVTLTGAGGMGKTRLALQVASELLRDLPDGAWLVELAGVTDPALVPQSVAAALGVTDGVRRDPAEALAEILAPQSPLLVLDNCEHLVEACAAIADHLLRASPGLRILATSREALGITGETSWRVPSLSLPEPGDPAGADRLLTSEAARLFAERAASAAPGFVVTEQNAEAVAQVCRRLDGIPLAIELAAARVKLLSAEQIATRLGDRFRLLSGGSRTALPRQQTLRATIDWSYALLSEAEQVVLRRLSVFVGGWTLEAAEAVCAGGEVGDDDVLDILARLVDKSMVLVEGGSRDERRYRLLETLRQYASERLLDAGEAESTRDRHRDWFLALAEAAEPYLYLGKQQETLSPADNPSLFTRLEREYDNLQAALTWSEADPGSEAPGRIAAALGRFWYHSGRFAEGRRWLERALRSSQAAAPPARAKLLLSAGYLAHLQSDHARAATLLDEGMRLCRELGDETGLGFGLAQLGAVRRNQGDYDAAFALSREALEVHRRTGNLRALELWPYYFGTIAWCRGDLDVAERHLEESLARFRPLAGSPRIALYLHWLGRISYARGDLDRAQELLDESVSLGRETGFYRAISWGLHYLGLAARTRGDLPAAAAQLGAALDLYRRAGDPDGAAGALEGLAGLALDHGQLEPAARLLGVAERLREEIGSPLAPVSRPEYERDLEALRNGLPAEARVAAWEAGRGMTVERAAQEAMALAPPPPDARAGAIAEPSASPLSPREHEVAGLVARGLMNREIAAELTIAERTVETHVANILGKLGLRSRAQVGAWAERLGLLGGASD